MSLLHLIPFTLSAWLGFFLIERGSHPRLWLTGLGLLFYAAALEINNMNLWQALRVWPPVFWVGAILYLDQRLLDRHPILFNLWKWLLLPVTFLLAVYFLLEPAAVTAFPLTWISFLLGLAPLLWTLIMIQDFIAFLRPRQVTGLLLAATLFFTLGEWFLLFPSTWLPPESVLPAIGIDLLFLGFCMACLHAFDEVDFRRANWIRDRHSNGFHAGNPDSLEHNNLASIIIAVIGNTHYFALSGGTARITQPLRSF